MRMILIAAVLALLASSSAAQSGVAAAQASTGVRPPAILFQVDADLPEPRPKDLKHGEVLVALTVDEQGHPHDVRIVRSCDDRLNASVLRAVQQWRFRPAMQNGHAVAFNMNLEINQDFF